MPRHVESFLFKNHHFFSAKRLIQWSQFMFLKLIPALLFLLLNGPFFQLWTRRKMDLTKPRPAYREKRGNNSDFLKQIKSHYLAGAGWDSGSDLVLISGLNRRQLKIATSGLFSVYTKRASRGIN